MKIKTSIAVASLLTLMAGCAHNERQSKYSYEPSTATPAPESTENRVYSNTDQATTPAPETLAPTSERPDAASRIYSTNKVEATPTTPVPDATTAAPEATTPSVQEPTGSEADRLLTQQVQKALRDDASLSATAPKVQISVSDGKATITGTAGTEQEKQAIESLVKGTSGVISVDNQLQVSPNQ